MSYLGAKSGAGVFQAVIAQMPPHDVYLELFAGTLAVMRTKPRAGREIALEIDSATIDAFPPPAHVELIVGCALDFLRTFDFAGLGRVLIYADPPYLPSTRTSRHAYRHELTEAQHRQLLALLKGLPANVAVMISGYPSALYDAELEGWRTVTFQAMTRGGPRTEQLWMNYADGGKHWHTFTGRNFTDRQRIKRKAERWQANYRRLPPGERLAVLAALLAAEERSV